MKSQLTMLLLGLITGLAFGLGASYLIEQRIGQRYVITKETGTLQTRMDRWTGKTCLLRCYVDSKEKPVSWFWEAVAEPNQSSL